MGHHPAAGLPGRDSLSTTHFLLPQEEWAGHSTQGCPTSLRKQVLPGSLGCTWRSNVTQHPVPLQEVSNMIVTWAARAESQD